MTETYKLIKHLKSGAYGKWYLVKSSTGELCVIKQIKMNELTEQDQATAVQEAKIMEAFNHPNIIHFKEVYRTRRGKLCIVMEYADGADLRSRILAQRGQPFSEAQILDWFVQVTLALKHMHDRKVLHRDLKTANIFLTKQNRVKLGDFGISKALSATSAAASTMIGTPYYLSPEMVQSQPYSFKSDVWALGILLYEMWTFKPPFNAKSLHLLGMKIVKGKFRPIGSQYSTNLSWLVQTLLQVNPEDRPEISQILKIPFISKRIHTFLNFSVRLDEFSHTVLHNENLFQAAKRAKAEEEAKVREETKRRSLSPDIHLAKARQEQKTRKSMSPDISIKLRQQNQRTNIIAEIRRRRRKLRESQRNRENEDQVMAYDLQEAILADDQESTEPISSPFDDKRSYSPLPSIALSPTLPSIAPSPIQKQKDNLIALMGSAAFNESYNIVHEIGLDVFDPSEYFTCFDHVIKRDIQEDILPKIWAIANSENY